MFSISTTLLMTTASKVGVKITLPLNNYLLTVTMDNFQADLLCFESLNLKLS